MARVADEIAGLADRLDVLINNAGGVRDHREITPEGNEITFAGNCLGHFPLTKRLMALLEAAAAESDPATVRVLATFLEGHKVAPRFDWQDLQRVNVWVPAPTIAWRSCATCSSRVNSPGAARCAASPPAPCIRARPGPTLPTMPSRGWRR
jgi:NAD(P)-dependent dehydrogenase (short-subunit alcohol dehydrogenase family)